MLLLLPGKAGEPGAKEHGSGRARPCAVERPADLAGTCRAKQRIKETFSVLASAAYKVGNFFNAECRKKKCLLVDKNLPKVLEFKKEKNLRSKNSGGKGLGKTLAKQNLMQ